MTRIRYEVSKQGKREGEIIIVGEYNSLKEAEIELAKITDTYARITELSQYYQSCEIGYKYRDEEFGWKSDDEGKVIKEN